MRVTIAAAAFLLAACGSSEPQPTAAPSSTPVSTATPTTATHTPGALADRWDKTFAAVPTPAVAPCAFERAQTPTCASFLTDQVEAVSALGAELRQRPDGKSRYTDTQMAIAKVLAESERYAQAKCFQGGSTPENCQQIATLLGLAYVNVGLALRGDDLNR